nr:MAG TPA: hypothetical protein [Caudoviricetes sp.]
MGGVWHGSAHNWGLTIQNVCSTIIVEVSYHLNRKGGSNG